MANDKNKVLNLDEVFGQDRPIKVKWQGREYELLRLEAFSPRQIQALGKMQEAAQKLSTHTQPPPNTSYLGEEQDTKIEQLFDEMLSTLCKDLPLNEMPFLAKMRIITFYIEETQGKKALEEAMMQAAPIGATS